MTEYDYSPEAELKFRRKMDSIDEWRSNTSQYSLANPFEPRTPAVRDIDIPEIPRSKTVPPPGDVYGHQFPHIQYPQHYPMPPNFPPEKPRHRHHSHHSKSKHSRSSSTSYASASTATLASRPMPSRAQTYVPPMPPMIMPQPVRSNTFPAAAAGYHQGMYPGGQPSQSTQWGPAPAQTGFIPPVYPNPFLGKPEQPLIKKVFALFRPSKGSGSQTPNDRSQSSLGHHRNTSGQHSHRSHNSQGHRSGHRQRRDSA